LGAALKMNLDGEIELFQIGEGYHAFRDYLETVQKWVHGMGLFKNRPLDPEKLKNQWVAFAKQGDETVGIMLYDLRGPGEMQFDFRATRFYYQSSIGRYLLLDWIARHVDQAKSVDILLPPDAQPETWLPDIKVNVTGESFAGMGRVLDVSAIGGIEVGQGSFAAQIVDPHTPWNEGIWQFTSIDGKLQVSQGEIADCVLTIQGLSALVYGTNVPQDFSFRGWGNPSQDIQQVMESMFPCKQPYLHEFF
jgi:predicted acetyltransferase